MRSDPSEGHVIALGASLPVPSANRTSSHIDFAKEDTDVILSYYQSLNATSEVSSTPIPETRQNSIASTSTYSSEYSVDSSADSPSNSSNKPSLQPCAALPSAAVHRRPSIPTQGGADRRRLAIVQLDRLDSLIEHDAKKQEPAPTRSSDPSGSTNSIRPHKGFALVAPPDTSPQSFSPFVATSRFGSYPPSSSASSHTRSTSEAVKGLNKAKTWGHVPRKASREVAIVGTANFSEAVTSDLQQWAKISTYSEALKPPLFQMPQSRSPSPGNSEISDSSSSIHRGRQRKDALAPGVSPISDLRGGLPPVHTPDIGQSKHIGDRVAGPIVINLFPESPTSSKPAGQLSRPQATSTLEFTNPFMPPSGCATTTADLCAYLNYQPGLHATAGPLPPPPKAVLNIGPKLPPPPRPPRQTPLRRRDEMEALRQSLQLPPHVAAVLETKSSPVVSGDKTSEPYVATQCSQDNTNTSSSESTHSYHVPIHMHECAFPPSRHCTPDFGNATVSSHDPAISLPQSASMEDLMTSIGLAIDDMGIMSADDVPPPTVIEPLRNNEGSNGRQGLEIRRDERRLDSRVEVPQLDRTPSQSEENTTDGSIREEVLPPIPAKSVPPFLDMKVKNIFNKKRFSALPRTPSLMSLNRLSLGSKHSSRSPSVTHPNASLALPIHRIKSAYPSALQFGDVLGRKTALERSLGYARKINELYNHDCGLADWMAEVRNNANRPQSTGKRAIVNNDGLRVPSSGSPFLEQRQVSRSSNDSAVTFPRRPDAYSATDLSSRTPDDSSPPTAPPPLPYPVLAALPRNRSSRLPLVVPSSPPTRSLTSPSTSKFPVGFLTTLRRKESLKRERHNIPSTPTEAIPDRPSLPVVSPCVPGGPRAPPNRVHRSQTVIVIEKEAPLERISTVTRRPSLFGSRGNSSDKRMSEADFNRQLDRLSVLLPRADRNVLALYLRRTGQDMLALGQYIEDNKSGNFRYDC